MKTLTKTALMLLLFVNSISAYCIPTLNSLPSAAATVYLDFNGELVSGTIWNGGMPIACEATSLSDNQIIDIFNLVSEDFRPFNINITTDSTKFLAAPLTQRIRIIITPTSSWKANVAGVSFIGSFQWGDNTPGFVFSDRLNNDSKKIAECCSHETGHTLGLSHQSKYDNNCNLQETYNSGNGQGETSWAPIMGIGFDKNKTVWNNGPISTGCSNLQDNLSIITSNNNISYRQDDYTDSMNNAINVTNDDSTTIEGIISENTDKDVFKFSYNKQSRVIVQADPYSIGNENKGANLDIKLSLFDSSYNFINSFDATSSMSATIDTILQEGVYYVVLEGSGNNVGGAYGSIGAYTLHESNQFYGIHQITLTGSTANGKDSLNWNIVSDNVIHSEMIEFSSNGTDFVSISTTHSSSKTISNNNLSSNKRYYRIKAISVTGEIGYSNVIMLEDVKQAQPNNNQTNFNVSQQNNNIFTVNTLVNQQIVINSKENFSYRIMDMNARPIAAGKGIAGTNSVEMHSVASGMYVIELISNSKKEIKKLLKQ